MRYLTVDGMAYGTGLRDTVEGGYLNIDKLGISDDLKKKIVTWLEKYANEHEAGYASDNAICQLDAEGLQIAKMLKEEVLDSKVEYYSSGKMKRLLLG